MRDSQAGHISTSSFIRNPTQNRGKKKTSNNANAIHPPEEIFLVMNGCLDVPHLGQR